MVSGLKRLGFGDDDIKIMKEPSWSEIHLEIISLAKDIHYAHSENERTLIFVYYAGHGMYDNHLLL